MPTETFANDDVAAQRPYWDADRRILSFRGIVVKEFKRRAPTQQIILSAFQEEGWPQRIDDPLPPLQGRDRHQRLRDAIADLNFGLEMKVLRFTGDGTGEGIRWKEI